MSTDLAVPDRAEIDRLIARADLADLARKSADELEAEIAHHQEQAQHHHERFLYHTVEAGRRLMQIKKMLTHGEYEVWLTDHGFSQPNAWRMVKLASKEHLLADLPPDTSTRAALEVVAMREAAERPLPPPPPPRVLALPPSIYLEYADASSLPVNDRLAHLILTSPPYGLGINYADTDDDQGYATYMNDFVPAWCREMYRVAAYSGRLCLNVPLDITRGGWRPMYSDWLRALLSAGWLYRSTIVWNKDDVNKHNARGSVDAPKAISVFAPAEMVIVAFKGDWDRRLVAESDLSKSHPGDCDESCNVETCGHQRWIRWAGGTAVWNDISPESRQSVLEICPAPFPEELARRCIQLFSYPGDIVIDPFVGSGTTAVVCARYGRTCYGFDHSERTLQGARERVYREQRAA